MVRLPFLLLLAACAGPDGGRPRNTRGDDTSPPECGAWTLDVAPEAWALPSGLPAGTLAVDERPAADCDAGVPATRLLDLTGDGRLDLVVLAECDDAAVGTSRWRVWPGEAGGFGDEIAWSLPPGYADGAFGVPQRTSTFCDGEQDIPAFLLADLDATPGLDLAVTASCADPSLEAGAWIVFPGNGAGFGGGAVRAVSTEGNDGAFIAPRAAATCGDYYGYPAWDLTDLDGDGLDDIVVTQSCDDYRVGYTEWLWMAGGADRFAAEAEWPVPPDLRATSIARSDTRCSTGYADYFLSDVDGDGRDDLVQPRSCYAQGADWTVYEGLGTGFATEGALEDAPFGLGYVVTAESREEPDCTRSSASWDVSDADGDGDTDVLVTSSCNDNAIGEVRWLLYPRGTAGWGAALPLALPAGYTIGAFASGREDTPTCGGNVNRPAWARLDLDGDGVTEIVVTDACDDDTVGTSDWRVYRLTCAD